MDKMFPIRDGNIWMCPRCNAKVDGGREVCDLCDQRMDWHFEGENPPDNFKEFKEGERP